MNAIARLTTLANLGTQLVAIYGSHGKAYGHARFDPSINKSVFELPYDEYLKIGPDILANTTGPFNQYFVTFEVKDTPDGQVSDKEKDLQAHINSLEKELEEVKAQSVKDNDLLHQYLRGIKKTENYNGDVVEKPLPALPDDQFANKSNLSPANPDTAAPSAPPNILDGQVEALRTARDLPKMADDTIEQGPDGSLEKVHRELHPVQAGSPVEDLGVDGQTGKTTTRLGIEGTHMEIIEEREKIEAPKDESTLKANVEANLDSRNIENQDAAEASTKIAVDEGKAATGGEAEAVTPGKDDDGDPDEKGGESNGELDEIAKSAGGYRKLRKIAQVEGVPGLEEIKTSDDLKAAIELHRESKPAE